MSRKGCVRKRGGGVPPSALRVVGPSPRQCSPLPNLGFSPLLTPAGSWPLGSGPHLPPPHPPIPPSRRQLAADGELRREPPAGPRAPAGPAEPARPLTSATERVQETVRTAETAASEGMRPALEFSTQDLRTVIFNF